MSEARQVTSIRGAAFVCGVSPFIVRGWMNRGLLSEPPWTLQQLRQDSGIAEPADQPQAAHGSTARWNAGCSCATIAVADDLELSGAHLSQSAVRAKKEDPTRAIIDYSPPTSG